MPVQVDFARHGTNILAAVVCDLPPEYHAYANDERNSGKPTTLEFTVENEGLMPVVYPTGIPEKDIFDPSLSVNVYDGRTTMLVILPGDANASMYAASIDMLLCSNKRCMPVKESISGQVPQRMPLLVDVPWQAQAEELLEREGESSGEISLEEGQAPPPISVGSGQAAEDARDRPDRNELSSPEDFDLSLAPRYQGEEGVAYNFGTALVLGLIAGLLLNAMPCVLPVLTLKVTGLLLLGDMPDRERRRRFRLHNLCFAAGILTLFTILAIVLGAMDLMWGQLYQSQAILLVMLLLVFLMGLSMLGVFTLPAFDLRIGENTRNPLLKSYCTGLVSTFLATPCSGPMLGGVLAWAFTQPMPVFLAVFWAVGAGMAMPYLVFSIWPAMARILPRPGNWMYVFEHALGFLLLGTALYILSILPTDKHIQVLCVLLFVSVCAWLWGRFCGLSAPTLRRRLVGVVFLLLLGGSFAWILHPVSPLPQWQQFSPQEFAADLGKKNLLVEFTADWCPNCKFLEATVLSPRNLRSWRKKYGLDLIRVDLTRPNAYAQRLLEMLGSKSIPLTAIFPSGKNSSSPMVLRDLYGAQTIERALKDSLGSS